MRQLLPSVREVDDDTLLELYEPGAGAQVRAGLVTSVDGAVAVDGRSGGLSSPADKAVFTALRAASDVVLVGAGTARTEDYGPVRLPDHLRERRVRAGRTERPALAVVTASGHLDARSRLFEDPDQRVLVLLPADRLETTHLPATAEPVAVGDKVVDCRRVVDELHVRGLQHVLCEGGPRLLASLIGDELVDELCLTLSPQLVGGGSRMLPDALPSVRPGRLTSLVEDDGVLLSRWSLR
jgi:riboflavin biosynthesis pyrimidine reductase